MASLPPQRRGGGSGGGPGRHQGRSNLSTREGVEEAERRVGKPCFHAGQRVQGTFACVACQFHIRNRGSLPSCPDCGEIVWVYMEDGPRPVPEGEPTAARPDAPAAPAATVQEGVSLDGPTPSVQVQEGVKLDP